MYNPNITDDVLITHYAVLYIDLLGQNEKLKQIKALPGCPSEREAFIEALKDTAGRVNGIRQIVREAIKGLFVNPVQSNKLFNSLPPHERKVIVALDSYGLQAQFFSDCCLVYCPIRDEKENIFLLCTIYKLLACANIISFIGLAAKTPVRGGIDIGLGGNLLDDGSLYGPVLSSVTYLENKKAEWPRIVVGDELLCFLESIRTSQPIDRISNVNRELAEKILTQDICNNDDGATLNFIGTTIDDEVFEEYYPKVIKFIESQIEDCDIECKVRERYELMHFFALEQHKKRCGKTGEN